jgi:flagellar FliJ protein
MPARTFKFKLQTVLDHKQKQEEEEQRELVRRKDILAKEERRLKRLKDIQETRKRELAEKSAQGLLNVEEIQMYHQFQKRLSAEISAQSIRVQQAQADVEWQREKLLEAMKERKTYEKLKEKHYQAWLAETEAEERKLLDEIATTKFDRNGEKFF